MSERKFQFRFFSIVRYEKEQEYLRAMHSQGWRLVRLYFPGLYVFESCEGEDVVYQLDYHTEKQRDTQAYTKIFEDCGWEYLFDFMGYSYFRKPVSKMNAGKEEIFCDDQSRLDYIGRVFKGRMIPLLVIFFTIILPQLFIQYSNPYGHPIFWGYIFLLALYLYLFVSFAWYYYKLTHRQD